jgi:4-amino-4-deoxy-L-arabinose transferase-like glycosyltransferase
MFFLIMIIVVGLTSILLAASIGAKRCLTYLSSLYLFSYGNILITTYILGSFASANNRIAYALLQGGILVATLAVWFARGRPSLVPTCNLEGLAKSRWNVMLLLGVVALYLVNLYILITTPQNIDDVVESYFTRVATWLQTGSILPIALPARHTVQAFYPLGPQAQTLWVMLFGSHVNLMALTQWVAVPVTMVGIVGIAVELGATRRTALFVAFLWALLPSVVLQSTHALVDLIMTACITLTFFLFIRGVRSNHLPTLFLSALAISLAAATKFTILLMAPGLAVFVALVWLLEKQYRRLVIIWAGFVLLCFAIFGAYGYINNFVYYGSPLGPEAIRSNFTGAAPQNDTLTNIRSIPTKLSFLVTHMMRDYRAMGIRHGFTFSGPLAAMLIVITTVYHLYQQRKALNPITLGMILYAVAFILVLFFVRDYTLATSRYIMPVVVLFFGMSAVLFDLSNPILHHAWRALLVAATIVILTPIFLFNGSRPLIGENDIREADTDLIDKQSYVMYYEDVLRHLSDSNFDQGRSHLGFLIEGKFPLGYLYGPQLTNPVTQLYPIPQRIDAVYFDEHDLDYLLVESALPLEIDISVVSLPFTDRYRLLQVGDR